MAVQIRVPSEDQVAELFLMDSRNFGFDYPPDAIEQHRPMFDLSRFRLAVDRGVAIGAAGSFELAMTVPGGAQLPTGGVTWVSVSVTHRRQGVMRQLMDACHDDIAARGEPLATLGASEGTIYERFGYGISCYSRAATIDRRTARMRPEYAAPQGSVRFVSSDEARTVLPPLFDRYIRTRPCEVTRSAATWDFLSHERSLSEGDASSARHLVHADGYVSYRSREDWIDRAAAFQVKIIEFAAVTHEAFCALWSTLLSLDLVGPITIYQLPLDSPLPYLLENPRSVRTDSLGDQMWVKPIDPVTAFGARTYGTDDRLVVECDGVRYAIESSGGEAGCRKVRTKPDIVADESALGPLLMGGVRASVLAAGRRLVAASPSALRRADQFFLGENLPVCQTRV